MSKTLNGTIALDKLVHMRMEKKGKTGMIDCLIIPIKENLLEVDDYGIHLPVRIIYTAEQNDKGQNGFIVKSIGSSTFKAATEEQKTAWKDYNNEDTKKQTPILGNIKDWSTGQSSVPSGAASKETIRENDDLPF